jgi:drug/metabolite transporter (DMT)-like permease
MSAVSAPPLAATLLPLASGLGYVAAVLCIKRASSHGVDLWRTAAVSNLTMALVFSPFWALGGPAPNALMLGHAALCAGLFFSGQLFTFAALGGDVSLATPVLGLKIIFVAAASALLVAEPVRASGWGAAILATAAVALLQSGGGAKAAGARPGSGLGPGGTVLRAALAALAFALCDVLVQRFMPQWGAGRFLPLTFGLVGLFSLGLRPLFPAPLRTVPARAWPWLLVGACLLALQAASMAWTLGTHGRATEANVLYSTRGLWSVLAVGLLGAWVGTGAEQSLAASVFRRRLCGAVLMLSAVGLVLSAV